MARLSGYLTGRMANPGYGGMLSRNIQGGMQGISDAISEKRMRRGLEAQTAMLTQGDPTDPRVQESVMAVGRQMQMDPIQTQKLIDNANAQLRQKEQNERAAANHQMLRATHEYNQKIRAGKVADMNASKMAVAAYLKNPENIDTFIGSLPEDQRQAATEAVDRQIQYEARKQAWSDEVRTREPFSDEVLEQMGELPGMEQAIETYKKTSSEPGAKANLMRQYNSAFQASLYSTPKESPVRQWEHEAAMERIKGVGFWPWSGPPSEHESALAHQLVKLERQGITLTDEQIMELSDQMAGKKEPPQQEATPPDPSAPVEVKVISTQAEYDALPDGATYVYDGVEYTKGQ